MELLKIILDFIAKIAWPVTAICIFLFFKKYIIGLFPYITRLKAGGVEVTVEQIAGIVEETLENKNVPNNIPENLKSMVYQEDSVQQNNEIIENKNGVMLAFTANQSLKENLKYDIYYDPVERNHNTAFDFIGLYNQGVIVAIGKVSKLVYCNLESGKLVSTNADNIAQLTEEEYNRIKSIIEETQYYELQNGCKFYLVEKFYKTYYRKSTKYPLRAKKYFWLNQLIDYNKNMETQKIAELLEKITWQ